MEAAMLMRMWPKEGPVAASKTPAPVDLLAGQVARVKLELSALE
jgi:hypothetical protein